MKKSEKLSAISGIGLLVLAGLFLVALLSQMLPLGNAKTVPVLGSLGSLLVGAYGFSSLLIPVFFFAAGMGCFLFPWNERIGVIYASSFIPFFTIVICEKVCASMVSMGSGPLVGIQIAVVGIVCVLLLAIEYFAASYVGFILQKKFRSTEKKPVEQKATFYPPIFPEGIIKEDLIDELPEEIEDKIEDEIEVENSEDYSSEPLDLKGNLEEKEPLSDKIISNDELEPAVEIDFPVEEEIDSDFELEDTTSIENVYVEEEIPVRPQAKPISLVNEDSVPENSQCFAPVPEESALKPAPEQVQGTGIKLTQKQVTEPVLESKIVPEETEPVSELAPESEFAPEPSLEPEVDVFGEDFFATAPVPSEDVFSKEYIEEFQLQQKMNHREDVVQEKVVQEKAPTENFVENHPEEQTGHTETSSQEKTSVHFQPIPEYSLEPQLSYSQDVPLHIDTDDMDNPSEAAFFDDPFGEGQHFPSMEEDDFGIDEKHQLLDESIVCQLQGASEEKPESEVEYAEEFEAESEDATFDPDTEEDGEETSEVDFDEEENLVEDVESDLDEDILEEEFDEDMDLDEDLVEVPEIEDDVQENQVKSQEISVPLVQRAVPPRFRGAYKVPAEDLLTSYPDGEYWVIDEETVHASQDLKDTLSEFKIEAEVTGIRKGPVITMFEILPAPGVKLSKIVALQDNIALRLAASSVRIVAPIPGKHAVGIEVPNKERAIVSFKELIDTEHPAFRKQAVPVILGKDITGEAQIIDLAKTPHLLIAGSTGSGKSVCVNSLILSILFKRSPQEVRMILIDPKIVELKLYNDIPHLLTPVITEPKKAFQALQYCLCEMERRYALLDGMGVREITSYNKRIVERNIATEKLPYIVVIIDEFADLMATTGKELESTVARLAAMSRAVGIHLVLATQRPSIDVITGLIKANIPSRIAFMVASKMDSRIIIDQVGAEKLLGKGDMLYASATDPFPVRIQGTFVSDNEVENVVDFVKQYGEPDYIDDEIFVDEEEADMGPSLFSDGDDPLYDQALEIVLQAGKASASYIQRRLKIGYNRAARLVEEMEEKGIVGPANGSKPREIIHMP